MKFFIQESANSKLKKLHTLVDELNTKWQYGVLDNGKHLTDTEDYDWGDKYRTIPVEVLRKEKIGVCWDFVNYESYYLDQAKIHHCCYLYIQAMSKKPDDIITHTFCVATVAGQDYYIESSFWTLRGVHPVDSFKDAASMLHAQYAIWPDYGYDIYQYSAQGMDKKLTDKQFFEKATENLLYTTKE